MGSVCVRLLEEEVGEVDLSLFLVGRGMVLQEAGDAEGMPEGIALRGLLDDGEPLTVGVASEVGVGEDDNLVVDERGEELGLEHLKAPAGEPDGVRDNLRENDRGLLALYNTDHGLHG